jgi:hypothetical protein
LRYRRVPAIATCIFVALIPAFWAKAFAEKPTSKSLDQHSSSHYTDTTQLFERVLMHGTPSSEFSAASHIAYARW